MKTTEEKIRYLGMINHYAALDSRDKVKFKNYLEELIMHYAIEFYFEVTGLNEHPNIKADTVIKDNLKKQYNEWINNT